MTTPVVPQTQRTSLGAGGVLVVDKPRGPTSHDVVSRIRRLFHTPEVGHAGTLDPMATGVLVIALGEATKLVAYLTADDKAYEATLRLGASTTSLDAQGEVVETRPVRAEWLDDDVLERALALERARTAQVPPQVSAIKIDGVAAHARVRRGEAFDLPPREVAVRSLILREKRLDPPELDLAVEVTKGYYVRSLGRDLAASLGTVGHLVALRRVRSGSFRVEDAWPLPENVREVTTPPPLLSLADAARRVLPAVTLVGDGVVRARQGKKLDDGHFAAEHPPGPAAWFDEAGALVAIGERRNDDTGAAFAQVIRGFRVW